jgi:hypothetical protein
VKADADEVALIVGAPKSALLNEVVLGLHEKDVPRALKALKTADEAGVDIKLFARLLLERMRAVMLIRNAPADATSILEHYGAEDAEILRSIAKNPSTVINSKTLLRFLDSFDAIGKTHIPQLPLELAVIDSIGTA